jgi:photosystem II stability/assembly factor-like uncharacterized protein
MGPRNVRHLLGCATVLALAAVVSTACGAASTPRSSTDGGRPVASTPASGHTGVASPTPAQSPTAARSGASVAGWNFGPDATSFVSATRGWALADVGCLGCARLFHTSDAGRHWVTLSRPVLPGPKDALLGGLVDVYFADTRNGYIFTGDRCAPSCVIATHDGGRSWQPVRMPPVAQLIVGGDHVYALSRSGPAQRSVLLRSVVGTDHWTRLRLPVTGPEPAGLRTSSRLPYIAADGQTIALLRRSSAGTSPTAAELGALWVSTDSGTSWLGRPNPCTVSDGGAARVSVALDHPQTLLVDCFDNKQSQQAQQTQHHLYGSTDSGAHWVRLADPSHIGQPALLADNGAGHAFLATESGGANLLSATLDGGSHWHPAITNGAGFFGWADLRFVDATTGFILGPTHYAAVHLYRTQDGGRTWDPVPLPDTTR